MAIYSLIVGMPGQWENVATMLNWISAVVTIQLNLYISYDIVVLYENAVANLLTV